MALIHSEFDGSILATGRFHHEKSSSALVADAVPDGGLATGIGGLQPGLNGGYSQAYAGIPAISISALMALQSQFTRFSNRVDE